MFENFGAGPGRAGHGLESSGEQQSSNRGAAVEAGAAAEADASGEQQTQSGSSSGGKGGTAVEVT